MFEEFKKLIRIKSEEELTSIFCENKRYSLFDMIGSTAYHRLKPLFNKTLETSNNTIVNPFKWVFKNKQSIIKIEHSFYDDKYFSITDEKAFNELLTKLTKVTKETTGNENNDTLITIFNFLPESRQYTIQKKVIHSPTGNCQMQSIQEFKCLVSLNKKELLECLYAINAVTGKRLFFVDLNAEYVHYVKQKISELILTETPYISTNGSSMVTFLLKLY